MLSATAAALQLSWADPGNADRAASERAGRTSDITRNPFELAALLCRARDRGGPREAPITWMERPRRDRRKWRFCIADSVCARAANPDVGPCRCAAHGRASTILLPPQTSRDNHGASPARRFVFLQLRTACGHRVRAHIANRSISDLIIANLWPSRFAMHRLHACSIKHSVKRQCCSAIPRMTGASSSP